jgi:hypothetical protein
VIALDVLELIWEDEISRGCPCRDCAKPTIPLDGSPHEYYVVHDRIWSEAGVPPEGGYLCVGCLQRRLGRRLAAADFEDCGANRWTAGMSDRLRAAMRRRPR